MTPLLFPLPPAEGDTLRDWLAINIPAEFPDLDLPEEGPEREEFIRLLYNAGQQYVVWCRACRALMKQAAALGEALDMDATRMRVTILLESAELDTGVKPEDSELF